MKYPVALLGLLFATSVFAQTPREIQAQYGDPARFSAERGQVFFNTTHGKEWKCASCHTSHPKNEGKHASTGKSIAPLSPAVSPERFSKPEKVEKWFKRNCNDVLGRACTPQEKGDVIAWILSLSAKK